MKYVAFSVSLGLAVTGLAQGSVSPEVSPDHRVTFRLRAPNAKEVRVNCEGLKQTALQKDDQGVWSLTTEPMEPDIYAYSFSVDGLRVIDPANALLKYNLLNTDSQVHVPGPATLPWELNDIPRGQVHRHFYKSSIAEDERDFLVYTPPGYDPRSGKRYPVLYLLHGYSDDATAWTTVGRANVILDNLVARKQAQPMIVVMPLGYGTMEIVKAGWQAIRSSELRKRNMEKFGETLLQEVMPRVEKTYRVRKEQKARAIAGLSMGGAQSLQVGLNHPELFAYVGAFSSGGSSTNYATQFPKLDEKANRQFRQIWIACGKEDGLITSNQKLVDWLKSKGIRHSWQETPGQHSFRVWRRYLAEFAPLLFQEK